MTQWNSWFYGYSVFEISFSVDYTIHHALHTISKNSILLPQIINTTLSKQFFTLRGGSECQAASLCLTASLNFQRMAWGWNVLLLLGQLFNTDNSDGTASVNLEKKKSFFKWKSQYLLPLLWVSSSLARQTAFLQRGEWHYNQSHAGAVQSILHAENQF